MLDLPHPIPANRVAELANAIASGQSAQVGQVFFTVDDELVWGTDPYGCDFIVAQNTSGVISQVLASAEAHNNRQARHPAEYSY